jgi:hypothetical protein
MGDQRYQGILLSVGKLTETLQQFTLVQRQLGAVQAHAQIVSQCTFLDKALLQPCDDLRVHAAMMIACYFCNPFAHTIGKTYDKFVSRSAGVNSLFHWAHNFDRLVQGKAVLEIFGRTIVYDRLSDQMFLNRG